jgi:hypothetical protein
MSYENINSLSNREFPNEAYADFMTLITKYNISNTTDNAFIHFFNKYSNLSKSPLPKSINQGRTFMNNLNNPLLTYHKTFITNYNDYNYYLYHHSIENCIKKILSIPNISQYFTLDFEKREVSIIIY